jgi:hypothetical protein
MYRLKDNFEFQVVENVRLRKERRETLVLRRMIFAILYCRAERAADIIKKILSCLQGRAK